MLYDVVLILLSAIVSSIFTCFFALFKTKYNVEPNPKFYKTKGVRYTLRIADKIEPHLFRMCGIISFAAGLIIFIGGVMFHKIFAACLLLPFFIIAGYIFYRQVFPFRIILKKKK